MTIRQKPSRSEKNVRNLGRGALFVGVALLVVITGMTARYGWTQTPGGWEDKLGQASINGVIDIAGAVTAGMWGTFFAMRYRLAGVLVTLLTLICAAYTYQAVVGFQSTSRETLAHARTKADGLSTRYMEWATETVTKKIDGEKPGKGKQETLVGGIETIGAQVRDQIKMIQSGDLVIPDGQATTFARLLGIEETTARSGVITASSLAIIAVHYGCLFAYGFIRQRLEPAIAAQQVADGNSKYSTRNSSGISKADARSDLDVMIAAGFDPRRRGNQALLASRWGWPPNSTGRWLREQPDLNMPPPGRRGRRPRHVNGNGHAIPT